MSRKITRRRALKSAAALGAGALGLAQDAPLRLGDGPVLGLGQGGPQFNRRGVVDQMRSGQGGYQLRTHGAKVPIPFLIGTSGWAMYIHQPLGAFDLTGEQGQLLPTNAQTALPID